MTWWSTIALAALLLAQFQPAGGQVVTTRIDATPTCSGCTVELTKIATLGGDNDPAFPVMHIMSVDSRGRAAGIMQGRTSILYYSAEGKYLWAAGGKGSQPGQFERLYDLRHGPGDSLWAFDAQRWTVTVLSPELHVVRVTPLTPGLYTGMLPLANGRIVVEGTRVEGYIFTVVSGAGIPMYWMDQVTTTPCYACGERSTAASITANRFWAFSSGEYRLREWSIDGTLHRDLVVNSARYPVRTAPTMTAFGIEKPEPRLMDFTSDSAGRLIVAGWVASKDWTPNAAFDSIFKRGEGGSLVRRNPPPVGAPADPVPSAVLAHEERNKATVIDVIDPVRGVVLASAQFDGVALEMLPGGYAYSKWYDHDGHGHFVIWRITVRSPSPPR